MQGFRDMKQSFQHRLVGTQYKGVARANNRVTAPLSCNVVAQVAPQRSRWEPERTLKASIELRLVLHVPSSS